MPNTNRCQPFLMKIIPSIFALLLVAGTPVSGVAQEPNRLSPAEVKEGWILLFNGRDLGNWHRYGTPGLPMDGWSVRDGEISKHSDGKVHLVENGVYTDFELVVEWKVDGGVNCGINLRIQEKAKNPWEEAIKYQISSKDAELALTRGPTFLSGGHHQKYAPLPGDVSHSHGQWNTARIFVKGMRYVFYLNEIKTLDFDPSESFIEKWPALGKSIRGHIGLQDHAPAHARAWFRNIKLRPITGDDNQPPRVSLVVPRDPLSRGAEVPLEVRGVDLEGGVTLALYADHEKLGESQTSPWVYHWQNAPVGTHLIRAFATDQAGARSETTREINVGGSATSATRPPSIR
jgi:hypothetical protein